MPTPNRGLQANATAMVSVALRQLEKAIPMAGAETELGKALMKAVSALAKHAPAGSGSPGVEQSAMGKMMAEQKQEQPLLQLMRQQGGGGAPPTAQAA